MKRITLAVTVAALVLSVPATAQTAGDEASGQRDLATSMSIFAFPTEGQPAEQQSKDQGECYKWAVERTRTDPFELARRAEAQAVQGEQAQQQASKAGTGTGAKGALVGAAGGALIGEIASNDAGRGAAWGAAAGLIGGRRAGRRQQQAAQQQAAQQTAAAQQFTQQQIDDFRRAFGVCLEAKGYTVSY